MPFYKIEAVPHFVEKSSPAATELRREVRREFAEFLRFLITSQGELAMHLRSVPDSQDGGTAAV